MTIEVRPITPDDFIAYMRAEGVAFGMRPTDAEIESRRASFELDRALAAFDDGQIAGTAGAYTFDLTLPGQQMLRVPGVSWVSVLPTHRRRGILTAMMRNQLEHFATHGEPLAMLTASESIIYGRFGYGIATSALRCEIERPYGALNRVPSSAGRIRLVEHEQALELIPAVYDRIRRTTPGMLSRSQQYWEWLLSNPYQPAEGFGPRFYIIYETSAGECQGFAHYRVKSEWINGLPNHTLVVRDLFAETPDARVALWAYCLSADLVRTIQVIMAPVDAPLRWLLADPRRLRVTALLDDLWIRLLDIPRALAARRYAVADRLVLEVSDTFMPDVAGRYRLEAGPDGTSCSRTHEAPDLVLTVADLGAVYLGGTRFDTLAQAGRVTELTEGAVRRADALFAAERTPFCGTPF